MAIQKMMALLEINKEKHIRLARQFVVEVVFLTCIIQYLHYTIILPFTIYHVPPAAYQFNLK